MKSFCGNINGNDINLLEITNRYYKSSVICEVNNFNFKSLKYAEEKKDKSIDNFNYRNGSIVILGDINIDNIEELKKKYHLNTDDKYEIIYKLYKREKMCFLKDLYGDFAFVIADFEEDELYIVRDQLGLRELFYTIDSEKIYFSSDMFLLEGLYDKKILNSKFFEKYYQNNGYTDFKDTPYINIVRVLSASYVKINIKTGENNENIYWKLEDSIKKNSKSERENIEVFKNLFIDSINYKMSKEKTSGIALSGGLDSTSIVAITKKNTKNKIKCYAGVFEKVKSCDEKEYIEETIKMHDIDISYVNCDDCGILEGYPEKYFFTSEPHINILNKKFKEKIFEELNKDGIQYLCDGSFADHILTGNLIFLLDSDLKFKEKISLMRSFAEGNNQSFLEVIYEYLVVPKIKKGYIPELNNNLVKKNSERLDKIKTNNNKDMIIQLKAISSTLFADKELGRRYNIESVHPFVNRQIIEFIYSCPGEYRLKGDTPKFILREAVKEIIPEKIYSKIKKTKHVELTQKGLRDNWTEIFNHLKKGRVTQIPFINISNKEWIEKLLQFRSGQELHDNIFILISLEIWLEQYEKKESVYTFQ